MRSFDLALKVLEGSAHLFVALLDFDQEPRLAITRYQEIDFSLFLVAKVPKFEMTETHVVPAVYSLEQVACDEGLGLVASVFDGSPAVASVGYAPRLRADCRSSLSSCVTRRDLLRVSKIIPNWV
jgi:hypothetical protein